MYIIERVLIINDIIKSHACSAVVVFAYTATTDRTCAVSRIGVVMICFVVIVNVQRHLVSKPFDRSYLDKTT